MMLSYNNVAELGQPAMGTVNALAVWQQVTLGKNTLSSD